MIDAPLKRCTKCKQEFPATAEYFPTRKDSLDGLRAHCRTCTTARRKQYYADHADEARQYTRQWRSENVARHRENTRRWERENKERYLEAKRAWGKANPEKVRGYAQKWRKANPETVRTASRRWVANNPEKAKAKTRKWAQANHDYRLRYHREYRQEHREERAHSFRLWARANPEKLRAKENRRRALKRKAAGHHVASDIQQQYSAQKGRCWWCGKPVGNDYHVDHVIPLVKGGSNGPENIVISCPPCNLAKGQKLPREWNGRLF